MSTCNENLATQAIKAQKELQLEAIDLLSQLNSCDFDHEKKVNAELWQKRSLQHKKAWQAAEEMWQLMGEVTPAVNIDSTTKLASRKDALPWRKYIIPFSLAASFALIALLLPFASPLTSTATETAAVHQEQTKQTFNKEYTNQWQAQHRILLPDNSIVYLNFNSSIKVTYSKLERHIALIRGEALFQVAKNPKKPFIVKTGNTTASALGTAFIVKQQGDDSSLITVTEGVVKVAVVSEHETNSSSQSKLNEDSKILTANEAITSSGTRLSKIKAVIAEDYAAWHRGVLIFKDTPLQQVLAEIDRYTPYDLIANIGYRSTEKITGTFFIKRLDSELNSLITSLNLAVINNKNNSVTLGLPRPKLRNFSH